MESDTDLQITQKASINQAITENGIYVKDSEVSAFDNILELATSQQHEKRDSLSLN